MKVPGIEEMVETYFERTFSDGGSEDWKRFAARCPGLAQSHREEARAGLLAVFETHVADLVQQLYEDGFNDGYGQGRSSRRIDKAPVCHDMRSIFLQLLKEPRHD